MSLVNWTRTERYALSARYQRYATTRGESDFAALSAEVAAMLNEIALTTEKSRALEIASEARRLLVAWPATHFGYRQNDITDIVALIDEAISGLGPADGNGSVQLSLVALSPPIDIEPVLGMMTPREQVTRLVTLASLVPRAVDRTALLRAALELLHDPGAGFTADDGAAVRRSLEWLREEAAVDERYARLSRRLADDARRAAANAYVTGAERALAEVDREVSASAANALKRSARSKRSSPRSWMPLATCGCAAISGWCAGRCIARTWTASARSCSRWSRRRRRSTPSAALPGPRRTVC